MSFKDDLETLDPESAVQRAYDQANRERPWTIARHSAAMSMGCKILEFVGPDLDDLVKQSAYSNVLRDVIIVSWLTSLEETAVIRINAFLDIEKATTDAFAWAEAEGVSYGSPKYLEGLKHLTETVTGILTSHYSLQGQGNKFKKKATINPPGKSAGRSRHPRPAGKQRATA